MSVVVKSCPAKYVNQRTGKKTKFIESLAKGRFQKKKKKLMEFSIKGPDPASQPLNGTNKIKCFFLMENQGLEGPPSQLNGKFH